MKSRILKDYQLQCFKKKFEIDSDNIILTIDYKKKTACYVLDGLIRYKVDYWYAVLYF